jgi:hypothetical protein
MQGEPESWIRLIVWLFDCNSILLDGFVVESDRTLNTYCKAQVELRSPLCVLLEIFLLNF